MKYNFLLITSFLLQSLIPLFAQKAIIKEEVQEILTYPFGDPDPVPFLTKRPELYPYFRFDGYAAEKEMKEWKLVTLENDWIKVMILPEVGGKVWGAVDKTTGNEFLYWNKVLKFRDIAMRGPWTSGGIEFNFGYIGHTPNTATPVNYFVRENEDGSVSCFIGDMDLHSGTQWRVEIRLPADKAFFETHFSWHNPSPLHHSYYYWSNAAIRAKDDLQFFYPGNYYIGHGGEWGTWPYKFVGDPDSSNYEMIDLSYYRNNNFGGSKSYHILGENQNYKGAYWHDEEVGMGHYSRQYDLPGQKLWIWALSRSGRIWEDLLTDEDGQYVEVQAGRMFNQADRNSGINSPFGQYDFGPSGLDTWQEMWFPVKETGGLTDASSVGVLHVKDEDFAKLHVSFMALQEVDTVLQIMYMDEEKYSRRIQLDPLTTWDTVFSMDFFPVYDFSVKIADLNEKREMSISPDFRPRSRDHHDLHTPYGLFYQGEQHYLLREYDLALEKYRSCLHQDSFFVPAYNRMAEISLSRAEYDKARTYLSKALEINTYDGNANYLTGILTQRVDYAQHAMEYFSISVKDPQYRLPSLIRMAEIQIHDKNYIHAYQLAEEALSLNTRHPETYLLAATTQRMMGNTARAEAYLYQIIEIDPLNHAALSEQYLLNPTTQTEQGVKDFPKNEFPIESFLEIAIHYDRLGLHEDAIKILKLSPVNPIVAYWLYNLTDDEQYLTEAKSMDIDFVFPHRTETRSALQKALKKDANDWKAQYFLGLLNWHRHHYGAALAYWERIFPEYAPFYIARGKLKQELEARPELIEKDLIRATEIDPEFWRAYQQLAMHYLNHLEAAKAVAVMEQALEKFSDNFAIEILYAKSLLQNSDYDLAISVLKEVQVLPFEGAREGHDLFVQAHTLKAIELMKADDHRMALDHIHEARKWPENLGVGQPYHPDERILDFLQAICHEEIGQQDAARVYYEDIVKYSSKQLRGGYPVYFALLAKDKLGAASTKYTLPIAYKDRTWAMMKFKGDLKADDMYLDERNYANSIEHTYLSTYKPIVPYEEFYMVLKALEVDEK